MAITLDREAYEEFRCFGLPDEYPKDIRSAVTELRQRGYDASVAVLNYLVEEIRVRLADDARWSAEDIDAAASELADLERYTAEAQMFAQLGVDAEQYHRALALAWDKVAEEFGDAAVSLNPVPDYFIMHVYPPRLGHEGYVEGELKSPDPNGTSRSVKYFDATIK
ncbi:MAG: hypothetical protein WD875_02475, partial [Pirellulales bacterium]